MDEETYKIDVSCTNCGAIEVNREIDKGTAVSEIDCTRCGCESLVHHIPVVQEEEEEE